MSDTTLDTEQAQSLQTSRLKQDFRAGPPPGSRTLTSDELRESMRQATFADPQAIVQTLGRLYVEEIPDALAALEQARERMINEGRGDKWNEIQEHFGRGFEAALANNGHRLAKLELVSQRMQQSKDYLAYQFHDHVIAATRSCASAFGTSFSPQAALQGYANNLERGSESLDAFDYHTKYDDSDEIVIAAQAAAKVRVTSPEVKPVVAASAAPITPQPAEPDVSVVNKDRDLRSTASFAHQPAPMPNIPAPVSSVSIGGLEAPPPAFPFTAERVEPSEGDFHLAQLSAMSGDPDRAFSYTNLPQDKSREAPGAFMRETNCVNAGGDPQANASMFMLPVDTGLYVARTSDNQAGVSLMFYPTDGRGFNRADLSGDGVNKLRPEEEARGVMIGNFQPVQPQEWENGLLNAWQRFKAAVSKHYETYVRSAEIEPGTQTHMVFRERADGAIVTRCKQGDTTSCHPDVGPAVSILSRDFDVERETYMYRGVNLGTSPEVAQARMAEFQVGTESSLTTNRPR